MKNIIIALILALVPIVFWSMQYYFSGKDNKLKLFRKHISCYYLDWLFVPFNLFLGLSIIFVPNISLLYLVLFGLIVTYFIHVFWFRLHTRERIELYMFDIKKESITNAGWSHIFFFLLESLLVIYFLLFSRLNLFSILALFFLFLFFASINYASRKIHRKSELSDTLFMILGIIVILIKLYTLIF